MSEVSCTVSLSGVTSTGSTGQMRVSITGTRFTGNGTSFSNSFVFANPTESLTIVGGTGADLITVQSIDPLFAASLLIYGRAPGAPALEPDVGQDVVRFEGDTNTRGALLEVFADRIQVADGVTLSTLADAGNPASGNDIVFRARRVGTPEIENLLPAGFLSKSVGIDLGADSRLQAASIYLVAQAEDRALATSLGLTKLQTNFLTDKGLSLLNDILALPVKVLVKGSDAHVDIGRNAQVIANDVIGIYATARSPGATAGAGAADSTASTTCSSR